MKHLKWIVVIFLISAPPAIAQNFQVVIDDTLGEGIPGEEIALGGHVINLTANALNMLVTRVSNDVPANWMTSLCLDICAAPWINEVLGTIPANDSMEFSIHFFPDDVPDEGEVLLSFNIPRDTVIVSQLFRAKTMATDVSDSKTDSPESFQLLGNYPNPFNDATNIMFRVPVSTVAGKLSVFSLTGQLLSTKKLHNLDPGEGQIGFQGKNMSSGTYFYRLQIDDNNGQHHIDYGKFMLLR